MIIVPTDSIIANKQRNRSQESSKFIDCERKRDENVLKT